MDDVESIYRDYRWRVFRFAWKYSRSYADAEDLAQDVWLRVVIWHGTYRSENGNHWPWLARLVRTAWIERFRVASAVKRVRAEQWPKEFNPPATDALQDEMAIQRDEWMRALGIVMELPTNLKGVLLAVDLHGATPIEYADRVGISGLYSRQMLFLARRRVRRALCGVLSTRARIYRSSQKKRSHRRKKLVTHD